MRLPTSLSRSRSTSLLTTPRRAETTSAQGSLRGRVPSRIRWSVFGQRTKLVAARRAEPGVDAPLRLAPVDRYRLASPRRH